MGRSHKEPQISLCLNQGGSSELRAGVVDTGLCGILSLIHIVCDASITGFDFNMLPCSYVSLFNILSNGIFAYTTAQKFGVSKKKKKKKCF